MALHFSFTKGDAGAPLIVVALHGRVDSTSSPQLGDALDIVLRHYGCSIVIDFSDVQYVSSAGWWELIKRMNVVRQANVEFHVAGMPPTVREVCELIGLQHIIPTHASADEAVDAIREAHVGDRSDATDAIGRYVADRVARFIATAQETFRLDRYPDPTHGHAFEDDVQTLEQDLEAVKKLFNDYLMTRWHERIAERAHNPE